MDEFCDHSKKHDAGIKLLPEDARKVEQQIFLPFSKGGFVTKDESISESLRLRDFYVDWKNGSWRIPSPTMTFGGCTPSRKLLNQLGMLADAIEEATKRFGIYDE